MALSRLCLKNSLFCRSPLLFNTVRATVAQRLQAHRLPTPYNYHSSSITASRSNSSSEKDSAEVAVSSKETSSLTSPSRGRGRRGLLWTDPWNIVPFRFNNGLGSLGNALVQVSENLNRLLENWSPSRLLGRMKEDAKCYKLRYEVPGLSKEDLRITVEDGFLVITGERKEEEEGSDEDEKDHWYSQRYGYYNTSLLLPDDAKVEEIKAELKDGVLYVTIPRSGEKKRDVREVEIN